MTALPIKTENWQTWLTRFIVALILMMVGLIALYTAMRLGRIYELSRQVEVLRTEIRLLRVQIEAQDRANMSRIDEIERTLFGDVLAKLAKDKKAQDSVVALWQKNRDKELRDRINRLEVWRLQIERGRD